MAKSRSPNYPLISLDEAIAGVQKVYKADYRSKVDKIAVARHLGYGGINGKSLGVISALSKYGLLEGRGDLRVTDDAVTILVDGKSSAARQQAIRRAALSPALFAELNTHFGGAVPSGENLAAYLQKHGFNPQAAHLAGKSFRDTMQFVTQEAGEAPSEPDKPKIEVGDYVQWESQGALQFPTPQLVTGFSPDGSHVFVEGTSTGFPMNQIQKADPPASGAPPKPSPLFTPPPSGIAREVFSLGDGEAVLQWPTTLDAAGLEDLEAWLTLVVKKLKRLKKPTGVS